MELTADTFELLRYLGRSLLLNWLDGTIFHVYMTTCQYLVVTHPMTQTPTYFAFQSVTFSATASHPRASKISAFYVSTSLVPTIRSDLVDTVHQH